MTVNDHDTETQPILPRATWWWLGLALLLTIAGWLYLRGYDASLPFIEHVDEPQNMLEALHIVEFGHARGVSRESYPPGLRSVIYPILKHVMPADAHYGSMLPLLRLITISTWLLVVVLIALLGALAVRPLTGLMAAAVWIVNPWVAERARWVLPDGYLTLFALLALWLALVGCLHKRSSFSSAAVYAIMLAIVFKTQSILIAPIVLFFPLINIWRAPACRRWALNQTFWNCVRFAIFMAWLLVWYPTLDAPREIDYFSVTELRIVAPSLLKVWRLLELILETFHPLGVWFLVMLGGVLLWRYRRRVNGVAAVAPALAALAWLIGSHLLPLRGLQMRQFFGMGAMLAILFGVGLTGIVFFLEEALTRPPCQSQLLGRLRSWLPTGIVAALLAVSLLPNYQKSDALARNFSLHDRRNDLMRYMDTSLPPGNHITDWQGPNFKTLNRAWGGYDGAHDYPLARRLRNLPDLPLDEWRANDAEYAILPYSDDPAAYFPDQTVRLKAYPPDPNFRDPGMVVLRLYPIQHPHDGQLGPIRLVGYDINATQLKAGDELVFRHYWQAEAPTDTPHHVYNHLLDDRGEIVAQADYVPLWDSRRDTATWDDPDEIMLGREFRLRTPPDLTPGEYLLVSGLYDPHTGLRLLSTDGADRLLIAEIQVQAPSP